MTHTVTMKYTYWLLSLAGVSNAVTVQAMNEIAQRMQLRHPNIATVMGVATEPVTEDPLMVNHCKQGSAVRIISYRFEISSWVLETLLKVMKRYRAQRPWW